MRMQMRIRVERGRRKAVLPRERNVLARHVRASLSKVSMAHSPFKKASGSKIIENGNFEKAT